MDLFFDATDATGVTEPRTELGRYFRRYGSPGSDYEGTDRAVSELVTNAVRQRRPRSAARASPGAVGRRRTITIPRPQR